MPRDEYYEMKDLAKQKAREEDQRARDASTAPKPPVAAMTAPKPAIKSAGMGDVKLAEARRGGELLTNEEAYNIGSRDFLRSLVDAYSYDTDVGGGSVATLDEQGMAALGDRSDPASWSREMKRMMDDPARRGSAILRSVAERYEIPTYGEAYGGDSVDLARRLRTRLAADPAARTKLSELGRRVYVGEQNR
jgi:hypothetical protein